MKAIILTAMLMILSSPLSLSAQNWKMYSPHSTQHTQKLNTRVRKEINTIIQNNTETNPTTVCMHTEQRMSAFFQRLNRKNLIQEFTVSCRYQLKIGGLEINAYYRPYGSMTFRHIHMEYWNLK